MTYQKRAAILIFHLYSSKKLKFSDSYLLNIVVESKLVKQQTNLTGDIFTKISVLVIASGVSPANIIQPSARFISGVSHYVCFSPVLVAVLHGSTVVPEPRLLTLYAVISGVVATTGGRRS